MRIKEVFIMRKIYSIVLIFLLVISFSLYASADTSKPYVMKVATEDPAGKKTHPPLVMVETFIQEVTSRSNGRIQIEYYPNRELGTGESTANQLRRGIIQGVILNDGVVGSLYTPIQVLSIPYLFSDREVAWRVLDGQFGKELSDDMAKQTGIRVLNWGENGGFRHYSNNKREIHSPADMKGLKIRTMNVPLHMQIVKDLGASPTPIAWVELYTSLQTGVVDGQENSVTTFMLPKLEEVQKYIVLDGHVYSFIVLALNEKWFQSLPEDLQDIVKSSMEIATVANRGVSVVQEGIGLEYLKKFGVNIYKPSFEEKQQFRNATQASAIEFLRKDPKIGEKWVNDAIAAVNSVEKELGYK